MGKLIGFDFFFYYLVHFFVELAFAGGAFDELAAAARPFDREPVVVADGAGLVDRFVV